MAEKTTSYSSFSPINRLLSLPPPLLLPLLLPLFFSSSSVFCLNTYTQVIPAVGASHIQFSLVLQSPSQMSLPQIKWPVAKTTFVQTLMELCCFLPAFDILTVYSVYILSPLLDGNPLKRFIWLLEECSAVEMPSGNYSELDKWL